MEAEKLGIKTPEELKAFEEKNLISKQLADMKAEFIEKQNKISQTRDELNRLKDERENIKKEVDVYTVEALTSALKKINDKLSYGQSSLAEEKTNLEKKKRLEGQREKIKKLSEVIKQHKLLFDKSANDFKEFKEVKERRENLKKKIKVLTDKLDKAKEKDSHGKNEQITLLKQQNDSIYVEIEELKKKRNDLHNEWNEKWRIYNDQQHLIDYIKRAEKHKDYLRRQEQKKKEIEEKEKAKVVKQARSAFADQIESCVWLINYFQGQIKTTAPSQPTQTNVTQNKEEELKKAQLKVISKKGR